jgi:hypothetical protein
VRSGDYSTESQAIGSVGRTELGKHKCKGKAEANLLTVLDIFVDIEYKGT